MPMPLVSSYLLNHPVEGAGALDHLEDDSSFMEELGILRAIQSFGRCCSLSYTLEV